MAGAGPWPSPACGRDPADAVALVARAKREVLLSTNRHRLRREDLEDCFSQATLELVAHVRAGGRFADRHHLSNALELRFQSRIRDRRRALAGRSPMQAALEASVSLGPSGEAAIEVADSGAEVERLVMLRHDLARVRALAQELSPDQRLVIASQLGPGSSADFCRRFGWSAEKYRKVAQRGRARLRGLMDLEERGVPSRTPASEKASGTNL